MKYLLIFSVFLSSFAACNDNAIVPDSVKPKNTFTVESACLLSQISYCIDVQKQLDEYLHGWKLVWDPNPVSGIYAYVATDGRDYTIAIRGSLIAFTWEAFDNWLYKDLNVIEQDDWPYTSSAKAKISAGSYQGWQHLEQLTDKKTGKKLWDFLKENVKGTARLNIAGHSLGGNLATVYASYLKWKWKQEGNDRTNIDIITFAAPAAGNAVFAKDFDSSFPNSLRVENSNDIVPKFPCSNKLSGLGKLYAPFPSASAVSVGYKNVTVTLEKVFDMISFSQKLLEFSNDSYCQTNGVGKLITIALSGKNKDNFAGDWFAEAGYQHGIAQYATALGVKVITCK